MSVDVEEPVRRFANLGVPKGKTTFTLILSLVVAFNVLFFAWSEAKKTPGVDFFAFWSVAHAVSQGDIADIYAPAGRTEFSTALAATLADPNVSERQKTATRSLLQFEKGTVGVVGTPFLFSTLSFWAHGDFDRDLLLFAFCCLVAYALAIFMLGRVFGLDTIASAFLLILFLVGFAAYDSDVRVGSTNQLQLFAVALFLWLQRKPGLYRDVGSGLVLGLAIMFKPDVALIAVLLAVVWLVNRRYEKVKRVFASALAAAVVAVLVSSTFFGTVACWTQWMHAAPDIVESKWVGGLDLGNYGFATVLHRSMSVDLSVVLLVLLLCAFAYVVWVSRTAPRAGRHGRNAPSATDTADALFLETASAVCLGLTFMLLSSKLVWFHYYVLAIPAVILAVSLAFRAGNSAMQVLAFIGLLCVIRFPAELLPLPLVVQVLVLNVGVMMVSLVIAHALWTRDKVTSELVAG